MKLLLIQGNRIGRYVRREQYEVIAIEGWDEIDREWLDAFRRLGAEIL